jgi:hypothetical protein
MQRADVPGSGSGEVWMVGGARDAGASKVSEVTTQIPDSTQRYRCAGCGNLTRFDVTRTRRTTEYWHFDLAGDHQVEEEAVRSEDVESVSCRWCGRADAIEIVDRASADTAADPAAG